MRIAALDIETFASIESLQYPDYKYLKRRGKEELSDEDLERRLALNPYTLSIVSAALAFTDEEDIERVIVYYLSGEGDEASSESKSTFTIHYFPIICSSLPQVPPQGERMLIENLLEELKDIQRIVTYNGQNFDLPVLRIRGMIHGVDLPPFLASPRFLRFFENHLDLADFLCGNNPEHRYTLDFVCRNFGIPLNKGPLNGAKIHDAFLEGYYFDIARYNAQDAIATALLYLRLARYLPSEGNIPDQPPTDRQIQLLVSLFRSKNPENMAHQAFSWLAQEGILTKTNTIWLIDRLKNG